MSIHALKFGTTEPPVPVGMVRRHYQIYPYGEGGVKMVRFAMIEPQDFRQSWLTLALTTPTGYFTQIITPDGDEIIIPQTLLKRSVIVIVNNLAANGITD